MKRSKSILVILLFSAVHYRIPNLQITWSLTPDLKPHLPTVEKLDYYRTSVYNAANYSY